MVLTGDVGSEGFQASRLQIPARRHVTYLVLMLVPPFLHLPGLG